MNTRQLRSALLGSAALLLATPALVQAAGAPEAEEVVVTARRPLAESQVAAIEVQRNSDSIVTVLSADVIGNLPDQNLAQSVGRLPGVGIERDQGQGRYINLRGAPIYWTTISFDGLSVVSPEGRNTRFDNIPSAIASQVTVQKALVPSMGSDAVAGNVDIRTRRAFDYEGMTVSGKLGAGYVELGKGLETDNSVVFSDILMDGRLGFVAQASYYRRDMATENWETDPYLPNTTDPIKRFAQDTKNKHYRLYRENYSGSFRADYKISENNEVFLSTVNTVFHDDELRDQFIFQLNQGTNAAGLGYTTPAFITGNDPVSGTVYGARISARITYRDNLDRMSTNTAGGEHEFDNGLNASWRLNYTWTDNIANNPAEVRFQSPATFTLRPTVNYDFRDRTSNIVSLFRTTGVTGARTIGAPVSDIESFDMPLNQVSVLEPKEVTNAYAAKLDFDYAADLFGADTMIEFGGLYTTREKENNELAWAATAAQITANTAKRWGDLAQDGDYLGKQRLGYTFRYTDRNAVDAFVDQVRAGTALTPNLANYWNVTEDILAGYVMGTTPTSWGSAVYGARIEHIRNTGQAYPLIGTTLSTTVLKTKSDDTYVYPSLHLNWDVTPAWKLRAGLTTSASRADFDDLRPNFAINDTLQTISGGNPAAKPEKQRGVDLYAEYYGENENFFSVGVYYKDISDVLMRQAVAFGRDDLDTATLDRSNYVFTSVLNGGDGYLSGIEFFYSGSAESLVQANGLPAWLGGFGVRASTTLTKSEVTVPAVGAVPDRKISLLGSSDAVHNLQLIYEKYGLSLRLAYQYRTPWGQSVGSYQLVNGLVYPGVGNSDIYWDSDEEVDFSARYQFNENLEVFLDALNLTNAGAARFDNESKYPIEYEKFGRRFVSGVRFNF